MIDPAVLAQLMVQVILTYKVRDNPPNDFEMDMCILGHQIEDPELRALKDYLETDPGAIGEAWEALPQAYNEYCEFFGIDKRWEDPLEEIADDDDPVCQECGLPHSEHSPPAMRCYICSVDDGVPFDPENHNICHDCSEKIKNIGYCDLSYNVGDEIVFFATRVKGHPWPFPFAKYDSTGRTMN